MDKDGWEEGDEDQMLFLLGPLQLQWAGETLKNCQQGDKRSGGGNTNDHDDS